MGLSVRFVELIMSYTNSCFYLDDHYSTLNDLPQIPEKHFPRLKHAHQSKVEFSKFLDNHQNDFWLICRIKFRFGIDTSSKKE